MKDYTVLEELKISAAFEIENAFDKGYKQGFKDCRSELTEEEAKAHYDEGYKKGYEVGKQEILESIAKSITSLDEIKKSEYDRGYKDACNDKDLITCKKSDEISNKAYMNGYNKGYGAGYKDGYEIGKKEGSKRMILTPAEKVIFAEKVSEIMHIAREKIDDAGCEHRKTCAKLTAYEKIEKLLEH